MRVAWSADRLHADASDDHELFRQLVRQAAAAAGTRYAVLGLIDSASRTVTSLALWADGEHRDLTYDLEGSPCADVVDQGLCVYPRNVARLFPADAMLVELGIEGYAGAPIRDDAARPRALLAVFDTEPLDGPRALSALEVHTARARAELGRVDAEERASVARASVSRGDAILAAVADIAEQLLRAEAWETVMPGVLDHLGRAAAASRAALFRSVPAGEELVSTMTHEWVADDVAPTRDTPFWQAYVEDPHEAASLRRGVIQHSRPATASPEKRAVLEAEGTLSVVAVPVFVEGELWGQLSLDECAYERTWAPGEDDALRAAAGTLGAAIARAEASARLVRRDQVMEAVATGAELLLRTDNWRDAIEEVLGLIGAAASVGRADLFECRVEGRRVVSTLRWEWVADGVEESVWEVWTDREEHPEHAAALLAGATVQHAAGDLDGVLRADVEAEGTASFISVPFFVDGVLAGFVGFDDTEGGRLWSSAEEDALRVFASIVGSALERELGRERERASEQILAAVASAARLLLDTPDWREGIDDVLALLGSAARASRSYVMECRIDGRHVVSTLANEWCAGGVSASRRELWEDFEERQEFASPLVRGETVQAIAEELDPELRAAVEVEGSQSFISVPLVTEGGLVGYLGFDDVTRPRRWSPSEEDALRAAAGVIVAAMERTRYTQMLQAREQTLTAVATASRRLLDATSLWDVVDGMLAEVGAAVGASRAFLDVVTCEQGIHRTTSAREWVADGVPRESAWHDVPIEPDHLALYLEGQSLQAMTRDVSEPLRARLEASGTKSGTVVPVLVDGRLWGLLGFNDCSVERVWADAEMDVLVAAAGALAAAVGRDMSAEAARQTEELLSQARRMEAVGRLAGGVAHDLNNYLTAIVGYAEFLREAQPPDDRHDADALLGVAERVRQLVRRLLSLSRPLELVESEAIDPAAVVRGIEPIVRALAGDGVSIVIDVPARAPAIEIAGDELERVLVNLALNGRDAMTEGGVLTLTVAPGDDIVSISVTDTGSGMDDDTRLRALDPFFTTKGRSGVGLGLSTVYGIVNRRGGRLDVESEAGVGTRVTMSFPRVR